MSAQRPARGAASTRASGDGRGLIRGWVRLWYPVLHPLRGWSTVLRGDDLVAFPLFSALLSYFAGGLLYAAALRRAVRQGVVVEGAPAGEAAGSLTAAIPFITSLAVLVSILLTGVALWLAARLLGTNRPYGDWVGLAAYGSLPGWLRLLLEGARLATGHPPAPVPVLSLGHLLGAMGELGPFAQALLRSLDPFQVWTSLVLASGFAAYSRRPLGWGVAVAVLLWLVQVVLRGSSAALPT